MKHKSEDDYRKDRREYQREHKEELRLYQQEHRRQIKEGLYIKPVKQGKGLSVYTPPKLTRCKCGKLTVNRYWCPDCLDLLEIPGDCLGWPVTADDFLW